MTLTHRLVIWWDKLFGPVVEFWCNTTGRNNFSFARTMLRVAAGLVVCDTVWSAVTRWDSDVSLGGRVFDILLLVYWLWYLRCRIKIMNEAERDVKQALRRGGPIPTIVWRLEWERSLNGWVLTITPVLFVAFWNGSPPFGLFMLMAVFSDSFIACHFHQGGKSVVRRAVEATRRALDAVAGWVHPPSPVPAPTI